MQRTYAPPTLPKLPFCDRNLSSSSPPHPSLCLWNFERAFSKQAFFVDHGGCDIAIQAIQQPLCFGRHLLLRSQLRTPPPSASLTDDASAVVRPLRRLRILMRQASYHNPRANETRRLLS